MKCKDILLLLVNVLKRGVDNSAPGSTLLGKCAVDPEDNEDLFGYGIHAQLAGCRSKVIQGGIPVTKYEIFFLCSKESVNILLHGELATRIPHFALCVMTFPPAS